MNKLKTIQIARIIEVGFELNESNTFKKPSEINLTFNINIEILEKGNLAGMTVGVIFNKVDDPSLVFLSSNVKTVYRLIYEDEKSAKNVELDDQSLITMLSLAVSHTRALMSRVASGTIHQNLIVPIINPTELYEQTLKKEFAKNPSAKKVAE